MHTPVLLHEAIEQLKVKPGGTYIDATAGEGGHIELLLSKGAIVLGMDVDQDQIINLKTTFSLEKRLTLIQANFAEIEKVARTACFAPVDGVLFDLGLSMKQLSDSERGFSYKRLNEPLDMRLDTQRQTVTAADLINNLDEHTIYEIFARNSEEINSRSIAHALVSKRIAKKIKTVADVITVIDSVTKGSGSRSYSRIFQALRIEVNNEFDSLKKALSGSRNILNETGRIAVITFHSVEDRIVKNFIKTNKATEEYKQVGGKRNFERSATLRVISFENTT